MLILPEWSCWTGLATPPPARNNKRRCRLRDCHLRGIARVRTREEESERQSVRATCASCCTLACSLAGDCFISSASLSLNFLNILTRKLRSIGRSVDDDKRAISGRAESESSREDVRRSRAARVGALFTWTLGAVGNSGADTGNPNYDGTARHPAAPRSARSGMGNVVVPETAFLPSALLFRTLASENISDKDSAEKSRTNVELHYFILLFESLLTRV